MVADVRWAVDALLELDFIDGRKIFVAGYSLGGTVGLYSAAVDDRIAGVVSVCGFTPMRSDTPGKTAEGIYAYSHLHGLLPRLGFFAGKEANIPFDFHEILAAAAPRPLLVVAPTWDQYASFTDIQVCLDEVKNVYQLYGKKNQVELFAPEDYNRFSDAMKDKMISWIKEQVE
jgi:pimeloyl-ACP methyl ester carboxylesterase